MQYGFTQKQLHISLSMEIVNRSVTSRGRLSPISGIEEDQDSVSFAKSFHIAYQRY